MVNMDDVSTGANLICTMQYLILHGLMYLHSFSEKNTTDSQPPVSYSLNHERNIYIDQRKKILEVLNYMQFVNWLLLALNVW